MRSYNLPSAGLLLTLLLCCLAPPCAAVESTPAEMAAAQEWMQSHWGEESAQFPFSFLYDGKPSSEQLGSWKISRSSQQLDAVRSETEIVLLDSATGLKVECHVIQYADYPAVEWIVYFENVGKEDLPLLENIQALDLSLKRDTDQEFVVHYANGGQTRPDDFQMISETLPPAANLRFGSTWALSSGQKLPFFNVEYDNRGFIGAVGWSGSWMADMTRTDAKQMRVRAGIHPSCTGGTAADEIVRMVLRPGERIRTPRMLLMFWRDDRPRGHNLWRRLLLAHYALRQKGEVVQAPLAAQNWGRASAAVHTAKINWWADHDLPAEVYWIDAGWSGRAGLKQEEWHIGAADRTPRPELYPQGLRPVSDQAHQRGLKLLLWFWPHTVRVTSEIGAQHPEWVVPGDGLDYGSPEVRQWMIQYYGDIIAEHDLDFFRVDGHPIIPADEGTHRVSFRQMRYIEGNYTFWDALRRRHPELIIDNCAAGGRKIDIETMTRSLPLWRSDIQVNVNFDPVHMQGQTHGISSWVPVSSGVSSFPTPYSMRSGYGPGLNAQWHIYADEIDDKEFDFATARKLLREYLALRPYFYGDYYPLSSYSIRHDDWMAWQFDRPEEGDGIVQIFRRKDSPYEVARYPLHGLDPQAEYELSDFDSQTTQQASGQQLSAAGLQVAIPKRPQAVIYRYKKL